MNSKVSKSSILKWRVYLVFVGFALVVLAIILQLYRIQIVHGEMYLTRAENQNSRPTANVFDRGNIYFTDKDGNKTNAATLKTGFNIFINPTIIRNPEDIYNNLTFHMDLDEEFYYDKIHNSNSYREIAKQVPYEVGKKIKDLEIIGLDILRGNWRFYPGKDLAAHTIGFMAYNKDELSGRYGLERQYNDILEKDNSNFFSNFFADFFTNSEKPGKTDKSDKTSKANGSIVTTINPTVQSFVQIELNNLSQKWNSREIGAIVMNPHTGEIISMALAPTFDLNEFNLVDNSSIYSNGLVESSYEMGSIVKPLTLAIGIDTGSITSETTFDDKGSVSMDGFTFYNYDKKARGVVDMQEVLNKSLNTGVSFVVTRVGNNVFGDYMKKIFEPKTDIDLPNEAKSLISNLNSKINIEYATASFGQGIAMSPISITRALASLGNGGKLVWPHLVKEIEYDMGFTEKISLPEPVQIFKPETSEAISRMLVNVVDEALKSGTVALNNYSIAAKTGTAQIASPDGGYYEDKFLHSFFGYFPAYDPQFIIFLYQIEPQNVQYASETLTEPFMNITKFLINHYDIEPDRENGKNEESA